MRAWRPMVRRTMPSVAGVLNPDQEIGIAKPNTCRKRSLIDQGGAALHRGDGSGEARLQRAGGDFDKIAASLLQPGEARGFMLMTFSDDERGLRIVGGLNRLTQAATCFKGPSSRCVAAEERPRERRRKSHRAVIKVIYQSDCPNR